MQTNGCVTFCEKWKPPDNSLRFPILPNLLHKFWLSNPTCADQYVHSLSVECVGNLLGV